MADPGFPYIYRLSTKLRDSNVFSGVCLSKGAFPPYLPGTIPPPRTVSPPPQDHTPPRARKAVSTHILECFLACHFFENGIQLRKICSVLSPPVGSTTTSVLRMVDCSRMYLLTCCVFLTIINREEFCEKVTPSLSPLRFESLTKIFYHYILYFITYNIISSLHFKKEFLILFRSNILTFEILKI